MQPTLAEDKDLSLVLIPQSLSTIESCWGQAPGVPMSGLGQTQHADYVTKTIFDDPISCGLEFQVFGTTASPHSPVVKIFNDPHEAMGRVAGLRKRINFIRRYMGGLMAPFEVLWDVPLSYTDRSGKILKEMPQPVVVVQQRLERIGWDQAEIFALQIRGLFEELCARGIRYSEKFSLSNIGYDRRADQIYLVDLGDPRLETRARMIEALNAVLKNKHEVRHG